MNLWISILIPVESLPNTYTDSFNGANALPNLDGNGAYLQYEEHFYELNCLTNSCTWSVMQKDLKINHAYNGVMMYLPTGYSCNSQDSATQGTYFNLLGIIHNTVS